MLEINPNLKKVEVSIIRKFFEESVKYNIDSGKKMINLTIGEPDLPQSKVIIEETIEYMKNNKLGYSKLGGELELREEISKFYKEKYNVNYSADEIIITVGSTEGLSTTIATLIQNGDDVICPLPVYPGYEPLITLRGAKLIKIDTSSDDYQLTVEKIKKNITNKTRAIILNYPSNPSGVTISKKNRDEILTFAKENDLYIISDEVYSELVYNDEYNSFLSDKYKENVIVVNGFSKSHSLTGWRIGYILSSEKLRKELLKVHQYTVTSSSIISQIGGLVALKKCSDIKENIKIYKERAEVAYKALKEIGLNPIKPQGAIYLFVSLREAGVTDSYAFALKLLKEQGVAVIPGIAFGMEGFIRLSLVKNSDEILEGITRIKKIIINLKKINNLQLN
ncbi:MAG: pyridoxal phosphate-dependent aminotransferase [Fusobacteriaceae bacterium]